MDYSRQAGLKDIFGLAEVFEGETNQMSAFKGEVESMLVAVDTIDEGR